MARIVPLFFTLALAAAQVATPAGAGGHTPNQPVAATTPAISVTLPQLQRAVENARVDLARLRVDKWKTDTAVKQQTASNIESLQRNLTGAFPTLIAAAQQNPSSLNASFKLYRNLSALYDVMSNVAENTGAFGEKADYAALAQDLNNLDAARRSLGDAMEAMTAQRDADIARIQQAARQAAAQAAAAPPKRVVIDDNEPPPKTTKTAKKKKPATTTTAPNTTATPKQ